MVIRVELSYIVDSSEDLALMYDKYNDEYFDGKLRTDVKIYWSENENSLGTISRYVKTIKLSVDEAIKRVDYI